MDEKKPIEMTFTFDDPGLQDQEKQLLIDALKSQIVAVLAARSGTKNLKPPQFNTGS